MEHNSLEHFIREIKRVWGPLNTETVSEANRLLAELAKASPEEPWLANLFSHTEVNQELYRDPDHGFVLLAYSERKGLYRVPHDHGRCWVIYAVQSGEIEMGTYRAYINSGNELNLVLREKYRVHRGESKTYLPEDIHDTRCISDKVLIFRLTSCDLKKESRGGWMVKYAEN